MRRILKLIADLLVLITSVAATSVPALASGAGFYISAKLPENQIGNASYFDLMVVPGQKQDLTVTIRNTSDEDIKVSVDTITATTGRNGEINYSTHGEPDRTLKYSFADLTEIPDNTLVIPAMFAKDVMITVSVPPDPFDGNMLGSIHIIRELTGEEKNTVSGIVNQYAYVTAVRLRENNTEIKPDFILDGVTVEQVNYRPSIVANIRNPQAMIFKGVTVSVQVYPDGRDAPVYEQVQTNVEFAPNSVFPFTLMLEDGSGIQSGSYTAKVKVEYMDMDWSFEQAFSVTDKEADDSETGDVDISQQRYTAPSLQSYTMVWMLVFFIVAGGMTVAMAAFMRRIKRQRKNDKRRKPVFPAFEREKGE